MKIKFLKVRDVKTPVRGTDEAAGIDMFVPNYNDEFKEDLLTKNPNVSWKIDLLNQSMEILVDAHERVLIPSGIKTWMDPGTALIAANKSGVAAKKGLVFGAQVIDSDYTGEVHISVINTTDHPVSFSTGDKLIQFIHTPVILSKLEEINEAEFTELHLESKRGEGGFGSTGTK